MSKKSILVAHSRLDIRKKICCVLTKKGYITYQASDGLSTLRTTRSIRPTLVLIDKNIKGMSCYNVAKTIEDNDLSTILFIVKNPDDYFFKKLSNFNLYAYVLKPIQKSQLERAIDFSIKMASSIYKLRKKINNLEITLEKREIINHSKGILMKEYQINESEAYEKLRKLSMDSCSNLVDISKKIIKKYS